MTITAQEFMKGLRVDSAMVVEAKSKLIEWAKARSSPSAPQLATSDMMDGAGYAMPSQDDGPHTKLAEQQSRVSLRLAAVEALCILLGEGKLIAATRFDNDGSAWRIAVHEGGMQSPTVVCPYVPALPAKVMLAPSVLFKA